MKNINGSSARSQWIIPVLLGTMACCSFVAVIVCLGVFLVLPVERREVGSVSTMEAFSTPILLDASTPTLEPTLTPVVAPVCEDTDCLRACLREIPDFEIAPLSRDAARNLLAQAGGYDLVRYRLDEESKVLKRIAIPTVPEYLLAYQEDEELHRRIWDYFTSIFPNDSANHVSYLIVTMDASDEGYSAAIWNTQGKWRLYVNLLEFDTSGAVIDILTHEYGHMLTLDASQIRKISDEYGLEMERSDFDSMQSKCDGHFFTGTECALANSYLDEYGKRFWNGDLLEAWIKVFLLHDKEEGLYEKEQNQFYDQYYDQFVTEYASTEPTEDIAESWTEFILRPKPTGSSIADQKVLFFYEYPELVDMRGEIIQGVCQYAAEQK